MRDLTEGSIVRILLTLSWSSILAFTLNSSFNVTDLFRRFNKVSMCCSIWEYC